MVSLKDQSYRPEYQRGMDVRSSLISQIDAKLQARTQAQARAFAQSLNRICPGCGYTATPPGAP